MIITGLVITATIGCAQGADAPNRLLTPCESELRSSLINVAEQRDVCKLRLGQCETQLELRSRPAVEAYVAAAPPQPAPGQSFAPWVIAIVVTAVAALSGGIAIGAAL